MEYSTFTLSSFKIPTHTYMHRRSDIHSYFDPESIMAGEFRVPVELPMGVFMVGDDLAALSTATSKGAAANTQEGSGGATIVGLEGGLHNALPGSKYRLPMWVAEALRQPGFASVSVPEMLNSRSFKEFSQDPMGPNIASAKSPLFFEIGCDVSSMVSSAHEAQRLRNRLQDLYARRYPHVLESADKRGYDLGEARATLPLLERSTMDMVVSCQANEKTWYRENSR